MTANNHGWMGKLNGKKLLVSDVIILFRWGQFLGVVCARLEVRRLTELRWWRHPLPPQMAHEDLGSWGTFAIPSPSGGEASPWWPLHSPGPSRFHPGWWCIRGSAWWGNGIHTSPSWGIDGVDGASVGPASCDGEGQPGSESKWVYRQCKRWRPGGGTPGTPRL